jgi:fructose-bisphosphate aldolase class II
MPVATPEQYAEMLDRAKTKGFAYPAINVSSSQTINAVLQGLTEAGSDGIIQVTTGGADYFAGQSVKNRAAGAIAFARFATEVAKNYPVTVALHTDHCPKDALDGFVLPLIAASEEEIKAGRNPLFQSHMWDGSAVPLDENISIAEDMLKRTRAINAILEVEIGVVGGEEDGVEHEGTNEALYTTVGDVTRVVEALGLGDNGRYIAALTFGNVHGVYKPGNVKLRPELLGEIQRGIQEKFGTGEKPLELVFHGGSGSTDAEIAEAVSHGVVKMNIDTDTQYAFSRSIADTVLKNYDGFLKVDGEVGSKKIYDPRSWGKIAESAMAARVIEATRQLGSFGLARPARPPARPSPRDSTTRHSPSREGAKRGVSRTGAAHSPARLHNTPLTFAERRQTWSLTDGSRTLPRETPRHAALATRAAREADLSARRPPRRRRTTGRPSSRRPRRSPRRCCRPRPR